MSEVCSKKLPENIFEVYGEKKLPGQGMRFQTPTHFSVVDQWLIVLSLARIRIFGQFFGRPSV